MKLLEKNFWEEAEFFQLLAFLTYLHENIFDIENCPVCVGCLAASEEMIVIATLPPVATMRSVSWQCHMWRCRWVARYLLFLPLPHWEPVVFIWPSTFWFEKYKITLKMLFVHGNIQIIIPLSIVWCDWGLIFADRFCLLAVLKNNALHVQSINLMKRS